MKSARCTSCTCAYPSAFWGWKRSFRAFFFHRVTWLRFSGPNTKPARAWEGCEHHRSSAIANGERPLHFLHVCVSFRILGLEALVPSVFLPPGHAAALDWSYYQASKGVRGLPSSNRASAKRSRQQKQERLEELEIQSAKLRVENAAVMRRLNEASEHIRQYQESNDRLQNELKRLRDALARAGVPVANKPADAAADADFALKVGQAGKQEVAEPLAEGAGNKRARLVASTSFEESEEEGVHSPSAITGATAPPSHAEGVAADAAVVAHGANAGNEGLARARAEGAGMAGAKGMGMKDADTLADAEFMAGLIGVHPSS
ncbi:unnamed protein product [Closterium sp. Naga37s-1]|nr:unnamed protein product [Closterium sp. Naga37s-1]